MYCVLHEPVFVLVQGRQGMEKVESLGKDESCDSIVAIYMNYLSLEKGIHYPWPTSTAPFTVI